MSCALFLCENPTLRYLLYPKLTQINSKMLLSLALSTIAFSFYVVSVQGARFCDHPRGFSVQSASQDILWNLRENMCKNVQCTYQQPCTVPPPNGPQKYIHTTEEGKDLKVSVQLVRSYHAITGATGFANCMVSLGNLKTVTLDDNAFFLI